MIFKKVFSTLSFAVFLNLAAFGQTDYQKEINSYSDSLYNSFDKLQKRIAAKSFGDTARIRWNNLPVGLRARPGLNIGNMTIGQ